VSPLLVVLLFLTLLGEEDLHEREVFRPFDVPLSVGIILVTDDKFAARSRSRFQIASDLFEVANATQPY